MEELSQQLPAALTERWPYVRMLGQGSFATVYLGLQPELGREVAVKLLTRLDDDSRTRFARESMLLVQVEHPNVMRVIDFGSIAGSDYFVTLYEEGESLRTVLADAEPVEWTMAVQIVLGIARGLSAVHARGIVHRDLSQGNVLLTARGPLLLDFGLALADGAKRITETGEIVGTPRYMAPEVIRGQDAQPSADVYACGVLLYEMLAGGPPFPAATLAELIRRQLSEEIRGLPKWAPPAPPAVVALMIEMFNKEATQRPTAEEVVERLELLLAAEAEEEPVQAPERASPGEGAHARAGATSKSGAASGSGAPLASGSLSPSGAFGLPRNHPAVRWAALSVTIMLALAAALVARTMQRAPQVIDLTEALSPNAVVSHVVEPLVDAATALASAARIVAPGGQLLTVNPLIEAVERQPAASRAAAFDERVRTHPLVRALDSVVVELGVTPLPSDTPIRLKLLQALGEVSKLTLYAQTRHFSVPAVLARLANVSRVVPSPCLSEMRLAILDEREMLSGPSVLVVKPQALSRSVAMPAWASGKRMFLEVQLHRLSDSDPYAQVTVTGSGGPEPVTQRAMMALEPGRGLYNGYFTLELDPALARALKIDVSVSVEVLPIQNTIARLVVAGIVLCGQ